MGEAVAWPALLALLGAAMGSFLSTLAMRWPAGRTMGGRSACDGCGRRLTAVELVPLLGWAIGRGRCLTCGAAIDPRHPAFELACIAIGALSGVVAPGWAGGFGAAFGWLLLTLATIDAAELWLPDPLVLALALLGMASAVAAPPEIGERLIGGAAGFASLWLLAAAYRAIRGREGLGGGDPKLFGAIGLWLGWRLLPAVLLLAALVGLGLVLMRRLRGRTVAADDAMPFGAFLAVAAYPAWLAMIAMAP